jgi:ATP-binding cassette, subfamily C (CFTR/MRP), member 1
VTHGVGYLPQTDLIVVLSSGTISEVGTYDQLLENNGAFAEFLHTYQLAEVQESIEQEPGEQFLRSLRNIN